MPNYSKMHESSGHLAHLIDLFMFKGAPENHDADHPVTVLVNHGYVAGFAPSRNQPLWSAYRVAHADEAVDYDRPHFYYADERIGESARLSKDTFGKHDGIGYHVGHMVPNEVINVQFGRLAQLETFFMTNMCPQRGSLNTGVWLKLENAIRNIKDTTGQKDHMWVIVGPVFGADPDHIERDDGKMVPIPEAFYCVSVDPFRYPYDTPGAVEIACFLIPQNAPAGSSPSDYLASLSEIEAATKLKFMPGWDATVPRSAPRSPSRSRGAATQVNRLLAQF
ncbi:DNA/RNA non-specific endonuclease [Hoeflea sp.]|uniref:DNA/RNA non-specific endonuclease n=1 Tax=Hoeflea sp. TaxID=1940281 RepID=UPI003B013B33